MVPVHPVLRDLLSATPASERGDYELPDIAGLYLHRTDLVTDMVQNHFKSCGLKAHKPGTGKDGKRAVVEVGFHSLRHTFVSLCRESNAPLSVVESIVGHSSPAITRHYTHVGELAAGRAVALLPSVMGEAKEHGGQTESANVLLKAHNLAKSMTAANWQTNRKKLLALLAAEEAQ